MGSTCRTCVLIVTIHLISSMTAQEMDKRGPQGFLGMRGKKEDNELFKRKPQFFVGVKGKKTLYDIMSGSDYYKRAPMGFMGMRGKKDIEDYTPNLRNSLIGQIDYTSNENDMNEFPFLNEIMSRYLQKIASKPVPQIVVDDMTRAIVKRGNMNQFFGVRGKKPMQKRLTDVSFRGKFIGVRGKKDLNNSGPQEIKFLLDNGPFPKRKGQMGFIGMRGKKWENTDLDDVTLADDPTINDETQADGPSNHSSPEMEATTDFFDSLLN